MENKRRIGGGTLVLILLVVALVAILGSTYNTLNREANNVDRSWAQVENAMQRRADLIPNLVETVKGYASHEEKVFTEVAEARSAVNNATTPGEYAQADAQMTQAIRNLNVVAEAYPELKANTNFENLQAELAGTENRLAVERQRYNDAVADYNLSVRTFPRNLVAGLLGFHEREYFRSSEGANTAPEVKF